MVLCGKIDGYKRECPLSEHSLFVCSQTAVRILFPAAHGPTIYIMVIPFCSHSFTPSSFSLNFWILPLPVIGNSFTKKIYFGIL